MARTTFTADGEMEFSELASTVRIKAAGTWGSGTLKIQEYIDYADAWEDIPNASWTADTVSTIDVPSGRRHKAVLSGSSTPSLVFEVVAIA